MSLSRLGKGLFLALALFTGPTLAFAQVSAIQGGVTAAANAANLTITSCNGTECIVKIIANVITVAINFSVVLLVCYRLYAGFLWMTSDGDKGVKEAKDMIKNAVAGLVLIAVSFAISNFVLDQLGTIMTGQRSSAPAGAGVDRVTDPTRTTPPPGTVPLMEDPYGGAADPAGGAAAAAAAGGAATAGQP